MSRIINKAIALTETVMKCDGKMSWGIRTQQVNGVPFMIVFISHLGKEFINIVGSYDANARSGMETADDTVWLKEHLVNKTVEVLSSYGLTSLLFNVGMKDSMFIFNSDLKQIEKDRYELFNN